MIKHKIVPCAYTTEARERVKIPKAPRFVLEHSEWNAIEFYLIDTPKDVISLFKKIHSGRVVINFNHSILVCNRGTESYEFEDEITDWVAVVNRSLFEKK